jgi:hypothetical protein
MSTCTNTTCVINEVLLRLMTSRIKSECIRMSNAGASVEDINTTLAEHILPYYEARRKEMLSRAMSEIDDMNPPSIDDIAPLSRQQQN